MRAGRRVLNPPIHLVLGLTQQQCRRNSHRREHLLLCRTLKVSLLQRSQRFWQWTDQPYKNSRLTSGGDQPGQQEAGDGEWVRDSEIMCDENEKGKENVSFQIPSEMESGWGVSPFINDLNEGMKLPFRSIFVPTSLIMATPPQESLVSWPPSPPTPSGCRSSLRGYFLCSFAAFKVYSLVPPQHVVESKWKLMEKPMCMGNTMG